MRFCEGYDSFIVKYRYTPCAVSRAHFYFLLMNFLTIEQLREFKICLKMNYMLNFDHSDPVLRYAIPASTNTLFFGNMNEERSARMDSNGLSFCLPIIDHAILKRRMAETDLIRIIIKKKTGVDGIY